MMSVLLQLHCVSLFIPLSDAFLSGLASWKQKLAVGCVAVRSLTSCKPIYRPSLFFADNFLQVQGQLCPPKRRKYPLARSCSGLFCMELLHHRSCSQFCWCECGWVRYQEVCSGSYTFLLETVIHLELGSFCIGSLS